MQSGRFPSKCALRLKKVCYKVSSRECCQRKCCTACTGPSIHTKMVRERHCLLREDLAETDQFPMPISNGYSLIASQPWHSEYKSINTNKRSTMGFLMSLLWKTLPLTEP